MRRTGIPLVAALVAATLGVPDARAGETGAWETATAVSGVNSPAAEGCPIESPDGSSLYLMSRRGPGGDQDIWVAGRGVDGEFTDPQQLPEPVSSDADDFCPTPLRGGWLLFVSNRGGVDAGGAPACGAGDIYLTRRSPATGQWAAPRNLGCEADGGPNGPGTEFGPSVVESAEGSLLFFSSGGPLGSDTQDVYVSRGLPDGGFGARVPVTELNTPRDDVMPNVRKDGLEVVFASTRPGGQGGFDIWSSSRSSVQDAWSPPVNLGPAVNTAGSETRPSLSWKAARLYVGRSGDVFGSRRGA